MQANTIIKSALRKLVVIPSGGTPSTQQYADGLELLNDILNGIAADLNYSYNTISTSVSIASGVQSIYIGTRVIETGTIAGFVGGVITGSGTSWLTDVSVGDIVVNTNTGSGSDVTVVTTDTLLTTSGTIFTATGNPYAIIAGDGRTLSGTHHYITTVDYIDVKECRLVADSYTNKLDRVYTQPIIDSDNTGRADKFYFNPTSQDWVQIVLNKQTEQAYTLKIFGSTKLSTFTDGTTEVYLPRHFEKALKDILTVEIAPEMGAGKRVTPMMLQNAEESRKRIMALSPNTEIIESDVEVPEFIHNANYYDISTDHR